MTPLVEPERQRLARLVLEAVEALGGSVFAAIAPLERVIGRLRQAEASDDGRHPEARLILDGDVLRLEAGSVSEPLGQVPGPPPDPAVRALGHRLRQQSEAADPELLRRRNEAVRAELEIERARADAELAALQADLERKKAELKESIRRAETDALTGLYNRAAYDLRLERAVRRALRQKEPFTLMLLDLDHFKEINDRNGHQFGDAYLQRMARAMRAAVRDEVDQCCRIGGDEFAILLYADEKVAERVARRVLDAMEGRVSIGIAGLREGDTEAALVARADAALYEAKRRGRGRSVVARDPEAEARSGPPGSAERRQAAAGGAAG